MNRIAWLLVTLFIFTAVGTPLRAQIGKTAKPKQANIDDMWVTAEIPERPTGVTHHTYRSDSMQRDVGYCIYLPPGWRVT